MWIVKLYGNAHIYTGEREACEHWIKLTGYIAYTQSEEERTIHVRLP